MSTVLIDTERTIDSNGNETVTTSERTISKSSEPEYVKIYTRMWCEFNEIPVKYRDLFFELVTRMTYCNTDDLGRSQIVACGGIFKDDIKRACGWTTDDAFYKGLKALCDCNAIKKVARGYYQINPSYAGKGQWKYDPKLKQGGIKDLIAVFNFSDKSVNTTVVYDEDEDVTYTTHEDL